MSVYKTVIENTVRWLKDGLIGLSSFYYSHNPVTKQNDNYFTDKPTMEDLPKDKVFHTSIEDITLL